MEFDVERSSVSSHFGGDLAVGLKKAPSEEQVRTTAPMEKKSVVFERAVFSLPTKTFQPEEYHHKNISVIAISTL